MGKKKKNSGFSDGEVGNTKALEENQNENENQHKEDVVTAEKSKNNTVVLKTDLHCEGCANKIVKRIRSFEGVEGVKCEWDSNKVSVLGHVDPLKLREKMEQKTHKKVELISPLPKKENRENSNSNCADNNKPKDKKKELNETKPKELPVTTAVMKVHLHCEGCVKKIYKLVSKTHGYQEMKVDKQKDMITVTGAMDMKALAENVKKHMRKNVEIIPSKKDGEKGKSDNKGGGGGGSDKVANGGQGNKMQMQHVQYGFPYSPAYMFGPGLYGEDHQFQSQNPYGYHAPQMFSDENPNACVVM
ncbi:hypothetical protein LIER_31913 [Lithospermum erythrorhizon]|uniref:HMA domain-containing protein n=1 Tax=Lithospermum erythrorhizon TaxID=34254 RepID=A0AAV3RVY7_LITER